MAGAWLLAPLLLVALSAGAGLAIARVAGPALPAPLVPGCGFAGIVAGGWVVARIEPALVTPVLVAAAIAGFWAGGRRLRAPGAAGLAGALAFVIYAAPFLLVGEATFSGYIKLDDTATWLAISDRILDAGPTADGLAPSTYEATLAINFANGYPFGGFVPLALLGELTGVDVAWLFQPCMAVAVAFLAAALFQFASRVVPGAGWPLLISVGAASSALLTGFYLWGGIKEVLVAALVATAYGVVPAARGAGVRPWIPFAIVAVALLAAASPGGLVWIAPALTPSLLAALRDRPRVAAGAALGVVAALAILVLPGEQLSPFRDSFTDQEDLGNLAGPLDPAQALGVWPSGDFRFGPEGWLAWIPVVAAACGLAAAVLMALTRPRGRGVAAVYVGGTALTGAAIALAGSPWLDAKALAIASPALLFAALAGLAAIAARTRNALAALGLLAVIAGLCWSLVAQWGGASFAPRDELSELQEIGSAIAGQGPALLTDYSPYGARHFLRDADPESVSELRRRRIPLRAGGTVQKGASADTDRLDPAALFTYPTLVVRRGPSASRPPGAYRLLRAGRFHDVWQRRAGASPPPRLGLGAGGAPFGRPDCSRVRELAAGARRLVAAPPPERVRAPLGPDSRRAGVTVEGGRYDVWIGGSVRGRAEVAIGGRSVSARHRLVYPGEFALLGNVELPPGRHTATLDIGGPDLHPGSAGPPPAGPVYLTAEPPRALVRLPAAQYRRLCGSAWDWIEAR